MSGVFVSSSARSNLEVIMNFLIGDTVIHNTHGIGKIVRLEEQIFSGKKTLYYVVQVRDLTVWVPVDAQVMSRLRPPTPQGEFSRLFSILSEPGKTLPDDRLERRTYLLEELKDGKAESRCRVIRDLSSFQYIKSLNENDRSVLKQASDSLLGEWEFSLSIPLAQAQVKLYDLLMKPSLPLAK
jgi:CarD family transcriptional regulator